MDILSPLKKAVAALPPTIPVKIYNFSLHIPFLRNMTTRIIQSAIPDEYSLEEGTLILNKEDVGVCGTIIWGNFEKFETELFRQAIKPGMNVVDIGANIGYYTLIAAARVGAAGRVFAYEPDLKNASFLKRMTECNNFTNVTIFRTALSNEKGKRKLYSAGDNKGLFSFADNRNSSLSVTVPTDTLDASLAERGWPRIDVVKMDIEGAEPLVLEGMKETLKRNPQLSIFCECYPKAIARVGSSAEAYLSMLAKEGFELFWMNDQDKLLVPIGNIASFLNNFPQSGESYRNILARRRI